MTVLNERRRREFSDAMPFAAADDDQSRGTFDRLCGIGAGETSDAMRWKMVFLTAFAQFLYSRIVVQLA